MSPAGRGVLLRIKTLQICNYFDIVCTLMLFIRCAAGVLPYSPARGWIPDFSMSEPGVLIGVTGSGRMWGWCGLSGTVWFFEEGGW